MTKNSRIFLIAAILLEVVSGENGNFNNRRPTHGSYLTDWNADLDLLGQLEPGAGAGSSHSSRCTDIPSNMSLCTNIGYNRMHLPNLLQHDTLKEATQQASSWVQLVRARCHPDTQVFLCSLFAPVCLERQIWPCRSLCEAVKTGCEARMLTYGFPWPEMLRCDQFPLEEELCIGLRNNTAKEVKPTCQSCDQRLAAESIVSNFCQAEFAMRIEVEESIIVGNDLKITSSRKKKIYKLDSLKPKDVREASVFLENGVDCECSILENSGEKRVKPSLIVMGVKRNDKLIATSMLAFNRNAKELGKAMKDIKKKNVCRSTQGNKKGSALPGGKAKVGGKKKLPQTTPAALTTVLPTSGKRSKNGGGESVTRPTRRTAKTRPAF